MSTLPQPLEYLSQEQVDRFYRDGYLCVTGFLPADDVNALMARSKQLLDEFDVDNHPMTKFTTNDENHVGDDYFLNSGDKIRYFLEEGAVDSSGKLIRPKNLAVNKIGHALHQLDPVFRRITLENERMRAVARDLKFHHDPVALQSMVICKQPQIGGEVPEHNDSTFLVLSLPKPYTNPPSALGFWIPLERCTPANGALSFAPGTHKTVPVSKRFVRLSNGGTGMENIPVPKGQDVPSSTEYVLQECEPGDLVIIHGSVLHKSPKNTSDRTRYAYTFHMIESPPHADYDKKNWLQPTRELPFPRVLETPNLITVS